MTIRRRANLKKTQLAFDSLSIEGGLLSPEWLAKIAQLQAPGQADSDYRVIKGLNLRDEIGRYWRIAQALWAEFQAGLEGSTDRVALAERFAFALFRDVFGFDTITRAAPIGLVDPPSPITYFCIHGRVPIAVASAGDGLDTPSSRFSDGARRRSAFGLVQEYLNGHRPGLWGIASDGVTLRLLRENSSLTRPTWIEADVERLFTEDRYADFVALWLLLHDSRFGKPDALPEDCWLEVWRVGGREDGVRARDNLRDGVESALLALGQGFLSHRDNRQLRQSLTDGTLTTQAYFQELLRLVYRIIFLLTIEERNLLHPPDAEASAKALYAEGYSLRSFRERASRRTARDRFSDLWESLRITFRGTANGEARLGLPALGGLFAEDRCRSLDSAKIENRALLDAIFRLAWLREDNGLARVNWRDTGPEELGSIYESLLELLPQLLVAERRFRFAASSESKGNARKLTSSYYTHDTLVQTLLEDAIEPLIAQTIADHPEDPAAAILRLTVVDPACGSGHFLLGAARRLAAHLARSRTNGTPSISEYREALRQVIGTCVYGVDRNPMAVELCKTALWMETVVPGRPLSFLDSHVRCGDALIGVFDLELLDVGIPSEAYEARDGDDKEVARELRQKNRQRVRSISSLPLFAAAAASLRAVELLPEETVGQVEAKRLALVAAESEPTLLATRLRADLFCAAFFARKSVETSATVPLTSDLDKIAIGQSARAEALTSAKALAIEHNFFHWPLLVPDVFARGGFDLVLGNPPWKPMSPDAKEWFAPYDPEIRELEPETQKQRIAELLSAPGMQAEWDAHCRSLYDAATFMKESGRFRLFARGNLGKGDFNVYRMFVETALTAARPGGIAAQLVPENLYNGANAAAIRAALFNDFQLQTLIGFENVRKTWFPGVHASAKFCLYVAKRGGSTTAFAAAFGVNTPAKLECVRAGSTLAYPVALVLEFSPDALAIAEIAHPNDVTIVQKLYDRFAKFNVHVAALAQRRYQREIDMGNDREDFGDDPDGVPLYEGRMVEAFDHRAKAYVSGRARRAVWRALPFDEPGKAILPQWRISVRDIPAKLANKWLEYRVGFCDVGGVTNQRFLMAALIPPIGPCGHSVPTITFEPSDPRLLCLWLATANAFCLDYLARKKGALHMTFTLMDSLPLPRVYNGSSLEEAIAARSLRLSATGPEMRTFWNEVAPLLGLDSIRDAPCEVRIERELLRAELDVLVARELFGITRDEMRYILEPADILGPECGFETFGALQRAEERQYREFRTRRLILEAWDSLPTVHQIQPQVATPAS